MDASQAVALPSGWSVDTLKESIHSLLAARTAAMDAAISASRELINERDRFYALQSKATELLINERDRLYDSRFKAAEVAVAAALAAAEKAVNSAFLASEKAVLKAEQAQKEYNERSNEFRGQLDDQANTLMPRTESMAMFKAIEEKVAAHVSTARSELEAAKAAIDRQLDTLQAEIVSLREFRSAGGGKDTARQTFVEERRSNIALIVSVVFGVLAFGVAVASFFKHP